MKTEILGENLSRAVKIIKTGGIVAVPTETVYGLAASGLSARAVKRIYAVKGRPEIKPLSLMVADKSALERWGVDVPPDALALAGRFWPGPLTIVVKARPKIPAIVRAGGSTVGLRCPNHPLTLALLKACKLPLAAPSANPSGEKSPKTAGEVLGYFEGKIEAVIDGGACELGTESTIIDMSGVPYRILRQGALAEREILKELRKKLRVIGLTGTTGSGKSTALAILRDMGAEILDCDQVYWSLTRESAPMRGELTARFGDLYSEGELDRKALGRMVFQNPAALGDLNAITHKYVFERVQEKLKEWTLSGVRLAVVDAVALVESGLGDLCDETVAVTAPEALRIARIMERDGISEDYASMRVRAQKSDEWFEKNCGHSLRNEGDLAHFTDAAKALFTKLMRGEGNHD